MRRVTAWAGDEGTGGPGSIRDGPSPAMADGIGERSNQRVQTLTTSILPATLRHDSPANQLYPDVTTLHNTSCSSSSSRHIAALESGSSSIQLRIDSSIMAAATSACCVMSAVAVGAVAGAPRRAQVDRVAPANNVLLSARRSSTIFSGIALPSLARSTEGKRCLTIVAVNKTTNDSVDSVVEDSSAAVKDLLQSLQAAWEKSDDKPAIAGLVGAGLIGIWAAFGLIGAIEKLPFIPDLFEIVGILFTGWFVYRYLLFKPDREELLKVIDEQKAKITGQ